MKHLSFPSIDQFRQVVRTVGERTYRMGLVTKPIITFRGTTKSHGCVHEDTLITLADGTTEQIKNIPEGTSILSYNEVKKEIEFDTVNAVVIQDLDKKWIELKFDDDSTLKCTVDHPIMTKDGWVDAQNLTEKHELITII